MLFGGCAITKFQWKQCSLWTCNLCKRYFLYWTKVELEFLRVLLETVFSMAKQLWVANFVWIFAVTENRIWLDYPIYKLLFMIILIGNSQFSFNKVNLIRFIVYWVFILLFPLFLERWIYCCDETWYLCVVILQPNHFHPR